MTLATHLIPLCMLCADPTTPFQATLEITDYNAEYATWMPASSFDGKSQVFLYGGKNTSTGRSGNKLRVFNVPTGNWQDLTAQKMSPGNLFGPAMTHVPKQKAFYLFGGWETGAENPSDALWKFTASKTGGRWKRIKATQPWPSGRNGTVLLNDSTRNRMLLLAGDTGPHPTYGYTPTDDLWAFDLKTQTWQRLRVSGIGPGPRWNVSATIDSKGDRLFVFGGVGYRNNAFVRDSHVYEMNLKDHSWSKRPASDEASAKPVPVQGASITYDESNNVLLLVGGLSVADEGPAGPTKIWAYDLRESTWQALNIKLKSTRQGHAAFYDPASNSHIILGGVAALQRGNFYKPGESQTTALRIKLKRE